MDAELKNTDLFLAAALSNDERFVVHTPKPYPVSTITRRIDFSASFSIGAPPINAPPADPKDYLVSPSDGAILWFVDRGITSVYNFGIVPDGMVSENGSHGLLLYPFPTHPVPLVLAKLTWVESTLPYGRFDSEAEGSLAKQISFAPSNAVDLFVTARLIKGTMVVHGNAYTTLNVDTTGTLSGGTYSDIRSVIQVRHHDRGGEKYRCFDENDMSQTCMTPKDYVGEVPAVDGIGTIVGPDILPDLVPPNADVHDVVNAKVQIVQGRDFYHVDPPGSLLPDPPLQNIDLAMAWITPWRVTCDAVSSTATGVKTQNIFVDKINPCGDLDITVTFETLPVAQGLLAGTVLLYRCNVVHVFASIDGTGRVRYNCRNEFYPLSSPDLNPMLLFFSVSSKRVHASFTGMDKPKPAVPPFTGYSSYDNLTFGSGGMYVGTQITTSVYNVGGPAAPGDFLLGLNYLYYTISSRNEYGMGELGPVRVIRYHNMPKDSSMCVKGIATVEAVPNAVLVPYVNNDRKEERFVPRYIDPHTFYHISSMIFDNPSVPIKRVWRLDDLVNTARMVITRVSSNLGYTSDKWLDSELHMEMARRNLVTYASHSDKFFDDNRPPVHRDSRNAGIMNADEPPPEGNYLRFAGARRKLSYA